MALNIDWNKLLQTAIPAVASIAGGVTQANAATGSAATQSAAAQRAIDLQRQMYQQNRQDLAPYRNSGTAALNELMRGMGLYPFTNTGGAGGGSSSSYAVGDPNSPYGSQLLGRLNAGRPNTLTRGLTNAVTGAGAGAAAGAAIGSIGGPIGTAIGTAVGTLSTLFGRGRKEANQLVPVQNQVAAEVDRITKAVDAARADGSLNPQDLKAALDTVKSLQTQFGAEAAKFGRAGPGGVATLAKYFDPMTTGWQSELDQMPAAATDGQTGGAPGDNLSVTGQPGTSTTPDDMGWATKQFSTADFVHDPGYEARLAEGMKAIKAASGAKGIGLSGGEVKSAERYGQNFATNEFGNAYSRFNQQQTDRFNRLAQLAGYGQNANTQGVASSTSFANTTGGLLTDQGAAEAAGQVGKANAITGAINNGANAAGQMLTLQQLQNMMSQYGTRSSGSNNWQSYMPEADNG